VPSMKAAVRGAVSCLLLGLLAPCGCATQASVAREDFAVRALCPGGRVSVTRRGDITGAQYDPRSVDWASTTARPHFPGDLERDRYVAELYEGRRRRWAEFAQKPVPGVYEADGCGESVLYACRFDRAPHGRRVYPVCEPLDIPSSTPP